MFAMVFGGYTAASSRGKGYSGCHGERVFLNESATPRCDPISELRALPRPVPGPCTCSPFRRPSGFLAGARACPGAPMFGTSSAVQADRGDEGRDGRIGEISPSATRTPHPLGAIVFAKGKPLINDNESDRKRSQ